MHRVEELKKTGMEFFPDVYVRVRGSRKGKWQATDVHYNSMDNRALFNYRFIMPRFTFPHIKKKLFKRDQHYHPTLYV